jgi:D,D-heptose 1,7-bisphosphate phosphatase
VHRKAVFLDRDGTINKEVNYLTDKKNIEIIDGVKEALLNFKNLGYLNIIITNQSAIARGLLTIVQLEEIHHEFHKLLKFNDVNLIDDIFYSPFHIEGEVEKYKIKSEDRKPGIGMILKAVEKYNINLEQSFFIGDSYVDMKCAKNAKLKKIMVRTGFFESELIKCKKEDIFIDYLASDLLDASKYIEKINI